MKKYLSLAVAALLLALLTPAKAEESNRGFYEGDLPNSSGKIVFFATGNHTLSVYSFDVTGRQANFGSGLFNQDGSFNITLNGGSILSGKVTTSGITAMVGGISVSAGRVQIFGSTEAVAGRFNGTAVSSSGIMKDVRFLIDAQGNIFFVGQLGTNLIGGSGTITVTSIERRGDEDKDDEDDRQNDRDRHEDENAKRFSGTFTITLTNGQTITGTLNFGRGGFSAKFILNGVEFTFQGERESLFNRFANISTRGFVNTGQGQLIGGFIITGGPKLVLIRATGPSLAAFGVTQPLADPKLQLFQNGKMLRENDDWATNPNADDMRRTKVQPSDSKEAALLVRLEPGAYTTVVTGGPTGTGIALVEVFEMDRD